MGKVSAFASRVAHCGVRGVVGCSWGAFVRFGGVFYVVLVIPGMT
jgi:hypothetical protein